MAVLDEFLGGLTGFEWDEGNSDKTWLAHRVQQTEAEQALLNRPLVVAVDLRHSNQESRFISLGRTDHGRHLTTVFTVRGNRIRVISARPMSRAERRIYGKVETTSEADS